MLVKGCLLSGAMSTHVTLSTPSPGARSPPAPHAAAAPYAALCRAYFRKWYSSCTATNIHPRDRVGDKVLGVVLTLYDATSMYSYGHRPSRHIATVLVLQCVSDMDPDFCV
jgi:hypothetical protein